MLYDHTALDGNDDLDGWYSILKLTTRLNPHGMFFMNHMPMHNDAGGDDCDSEDDGSIIEWPDFKYGTFFYHQRNQHNMINSKWWQSCFAIKKWIRLDSGQAFHLPGWSKHCAWLETSWSRQRNLWGRKKATADLWSVKVIGYPLGNEFISNPNRHFLSRWFSELPVWWDMLASWMGRFCCRMISLPKTRTGVYWCSTEI